MSETQGDLLLDALNDSIIEEDNDLLTSALDEVPYGTLNEDQFYTLLINLLHTAAAYQRAMQAQIILKAFEDKDPLRVLNDKFILPLLTSIFLKRQASDALLSFLAKSITTMSLFDHLLALTEYTQTPAIQDGCYRLIRAYDDETYNNYLRLLDEAKRYDNIMMEDFLLDRLQALSPYARVPKHIINVENPEYKKISPDGHLLYDADLQNEDGSAKNVRTEPSSSLNLPSTTEAIRLLTIGLRTAGIDIKKQEESRQILTRRYAIATLEEKYNMLEPILKIEYRKGLETDVEIFRIMGPCNAILDVDLDINHICTKYGGCRMFTCVDFEYWDNEDPDAELGDPEWFTGVCDWCTAKIRNRYYALRRPLLKGGWQGCYCSIGCLKDEIEQTYSSQDIMAKLLVEILEAQLTKYGIYDRKIYGEPELIINPGDEEISDAERMAQQKIERPIETQLTAEELPNIDEFQVEGEPIKGLETIEEVEGPNIEPQEEITE